MRSINKYENYPVWIVILSNLGSLMTYGSGFIILYRLGLIFSFLYLVFVFTLEYRLIKHHCINCYYWGKICGFGKGRISSLFFQKGDIYKFCVKPVSFIDMIPELLITLIPAATGVVILVKNFDIMLFAALLFLIMITTIGNAFIRGQLTCKFCTQRESGCPADQMFNKK